MLSRPEFNALFIPELADIRIALVYILFIYKVVHDLMHISTSVAVGIGITNGSKV